MKTYKILEVCIDLDGGGTDRYVYNYCTRINDIHFDYASVINKEGILEQPLKDTGASVLKYPRIGKGIIGNFMAFYHFMKEGKYDAIHVHLCYSSFIPLLAAKLCGIRTRISHSHFANIPESTKKKVLRLFTTKLAKMFATDLAACGVDAAKWLWGEKDYNLGKVKVHNNAIDTELYKFSNQKRGEIRSTFGIADSTLVVGHVGRISDQKNQKRLVRIFGEIVKRNPDSILMMVGYIDQNYELDPIIRELGITNKVMTLGVRSDVPDLLNAMDVFVFPSKFEGLPFTLVETQCNGLPCVCSDAVTKDVNFSNSIQFISLAESDEKWAKKAIDESSRIRNKDAVQHVINAGYDLQTEAGKLSEYYCQLIKKNGKYIQ